MGSCLTPWPHLELDGFIENADQLKDWPTHGWQMMKHSDSMLPDGTSRRRYQLLENAFPDVAKQLLSAETERFFRDAFGVEQSLYPFALLVEDAPGYWIRLHPDCAGKVISCQFYLADDDLHQSQGVTLQTWTGDHSKQIPYRFNHGYAFKVAKNSWHRVRKCDAIRKSIQLIYYDTPQPRM